ncbi:hypothetical protein IVB15_28395 [Bradyrhizobium sp. 182]|uniref:hypothetical protein n=1 Tax=Bradyrhizobium sp. 182 TaxID=2782651 RepID=UPI001FFA9584|nr:hypothetical protein [Bradyrhizobium sp. 182]MCK1531509.1 hypothetical protein [Bradyrhizobium sp. 182]
MQTFQHAICNRARPLCGRAWRKPSDADAALPRREPQRRRALDARSFGRIADTAKISILVLNALLSGVTLTMSFLVRLAREMPRFSYFNIEVPFAAAKPLTLTDSGGEAILSPFDVEEDISMMPVLDADASGTIPGALLLDLLRPVIDHHTTGRRREAALPMEECCR